MSAFSARPELLSPAGDWDCARAAVENGADAIYFGLECGFNARARAKNFAVDDLPDLMHFLHQRGVKGYVTLNTLAFTDELVAVEELIRQVAAAGVDALLVQDFGVARLVRQVSPQLPLHASTQMTLTSAECIQVAQELGIERVVLARELSIREIRAIREKSDMALEVFVHGALCVAYSGQCLTSESLGGRSANRGQCAQACRLAYDLICDGELTDLGDQKYLLSPQDLAAYELTPELIAAGVCSFKIEGRLKTPEYVANITRHYRRALDAAVAGLPVQFTRTDRQEMELSFSRGFSPGWLGGNDHKMLVPATSSAKRGVLLGTVQLVRGDRVLIEVQCPISRGDGVVFEGDREQNDEQGGRVFHVYLRGTSVETPVNSGFVELAFDRDAIDVSQLSHGQHVWKTDDPQLNQRLRKSFNNADPQRRSPLHLQVRAVSGEPLRIVAQSTNGRTATVLSAQPLEPARQHPVTHAVLVTQLGRLGGSVYELGEVDAVIEGEPMVPLSVLGALRKELLQQLTQPTENSGWPVATAPVLASMLALPTRAAGEATRTLEAGTDASQPTRLHVLCRSLSQLEHLLFSGIQHLYVDFQDIREYRPAVKLAHEWGARIFLATPRIQKPDEMGIFRVLRKHGADGMLVRNLAGLAYFIQEQVPVVADFSLNVANPLAARYVRELGPDRMTASYDLNREQLLGLVQAVPTAWMEIVIHQHMPMFHMEHCVFCAVLSPGTNKTNCGRPCDTHLVELRDRIGMEHPLTADVGCRNTLFNAVPQSAAEVVPQLQRLGIRNFRIELLRDEPAQIDEIIRLYQQLLAGNITGPDVWQALKATNRVGVTRGTLEERRNPLAIL